MFAPILLMLYIVKKISTSSSPKLADRAVAKQESSGPRSGRRNDLSKLTYFNPAAQIFRYN